jgi:acetyltransferase-like isoleucine patch superfamily enzyme
VIFTHDLSRHFHADTFVGRNCFIGAHAIVLPGVRIGDGCIVGAGAVVTGDVPDGCIVAGNPAQILRAGIVTRKWGILADAYEAALAREQTERTAAQ